MKILLADDHALFREGMHHVLCQLEEETSVLEASSFLEALNIAEGNPDLDLALLDLKMPGSDGFSSIGLFHMRYPDVSIVVISGADQREDIVGAIKSGAVGFVSKSSTGKEMIQALRMILDGGTYLPPQLLQIASLDEGWGDGRSWRTNKYGLTARQMEMLQCIAKGMSNKTIAETTGLAEGTVKIHVAGVFQALHVNNRNEAVQMGRRLGLLVDTEPS